MEAKLLRSMVESLSDGVIAADVDGNVLVYNAAAQRLTGVGQQDAPMQAWSEAYGLFGADMKTLVPVAELPLMRAIRGQETSDVDLFVRNELLPRGRWISASGKPWRDTDGTLLGGVVVLRDIEARHQAEEAVQQANRFLDSILENVPSMIFLKEAENLRFVRFNRAGEDLLGQSRHALLGRNDYDFFPKEQADFFVERDRETLAGKQVVDIPEERIATASGERWLHTRKVPLLDDHGQPQYLLGISHDITEQRMAKEVLRRSHEELEARVRERTVELEQANTELCREIVERVRAEEALRRSEEQLRQAQKMEAIGRLAGGVAHDFNNMLTAILSYARMMADERAEGTQDREDLEQICEAAERAAKLTHQLLAFSRQQVLQPVNLDLRDVVLGMEGMLRRLIGEDVELRTFCAQEVGPVRADPNQIELVILNLAVNARDAMPGGGRLTIEVGEVDVQDGLAASHLVLAPGRYTLLAVSDTGVGIPADVKARIFEPFFTTKPRGKGTGLGLSTVFGIVRQSGGDIAVYSEPDQGTTFRVYLPLAESEADDGPTRLPHSAQAVEVGEGTVLLVEDEPLVAEAARKVLEAKGYAVLSADTPAAAIRLSAAHPGPIQLLLTDVIMPGMNGRELADRLVDQRPGMRVLFMSGYTDNAIVHHGVLDAHVEFLAKPFTPDALARKVADVLKR
jgi:PAS domain S-box-containing protein